MINNMFMKDYDTFMKELKEGKIEHPEDWITVDLAKARRMEGNEIYGDEE